MLRSHLRCAAKELPLKYPNHIETLDKILFGSTYQQHVDELLELRKVRVQQQMGLFRFIHAPGKHCGPDISLRAMGESTFQVNIIKELTCFHVALLYRSLMRRRMKLWPQLSILVSSLNYLKGRYISTR